MDEFRDLGGLTTTATILVGTYAVTDILAAGLDMAFGPPSETSFGIVDALAIADFLIILGCVIVVGRWIYLASKNAHLLSSDLTISPGWAVGWYFVPFANLIKPFHAMREIWWASHDSGGGYEERAPQLVGWWWGLWITTNILANVSWRFGELGIGPTFALLSAALNIPLCIILIMLMREIESSQRYVRHAIAFA